MQNGIDLRKAKRYQLSAPARFLWARQDGKPQSGQGVTRDINTFGVFVVTDEVPPVGVRIQMEVLLPKLADPGAGMHLYGEGIVLRREPRGALSTGNGEAGFSASVQFYPEATASVLSNLEITGWVV